MGELPKTREYLARVYGANAVVTGLLVAALVAAAILAMLVLRARGTTWIVMFAFFGFGSAALAAIKHASNSISSRLRGHSELRKDLQAAGRQLFDLSESTSLGKRVEPKIAAELEKAAQVSISTLHGVQSVAKSQGELAREIELSIHEAMHEAISIALPFIRPVGFGKAKHEENLKHLNLDQAVTEIATLTEKMTAVKVSVTGSESNTLRLDQTLARLQELKVAEAELNETIKS